jgi:hypothetical protein
MRFGGEWCASDAADPDFRAERPYNWLGYWCCVDLKLSASARSRSAEFAPSFLISETAAILASQLPTMLAAVA